MDKISEKKPDSTRTIIKLPRSLKRIKQIALDTFTLPNGQTCTWESLYFPPKKPTVLVAPVTKNNTLLLVSLFRFPTGEFVYNLPGGAINDGESYEEGAQRELLEETGYASDPLEKLTSFFIWDGKSNAHAIVYGARNPTKIAEPTLDEVETYTSLHVTEQAPHKIIEGITQGNRAYLPCISHALIALLRKKWISL
jgi:ADP-ribose pyrophosphatase